MQRQRYLDISKGLGILCITFLHYENSIIPGEANIFIGSFMITIFYLVAGWIMAMKPNSQSTRDLFRRRLKSLGLPYLYWTIIILAFDAILWAFGYYDTYFMAREAYKSVVLRGIGTLWFLPAIFAGEIGWNWLKSRSKWVWIAAFAAIVAYDYAYGSFFSGRTSSLWKIIEAPFFTLSHAFGAVVYVAAGYLAFKLCDRFANSPWRNALIGTLSLILAYFGANFLYVLLGDASGLFWPWIAPILGPLGFILLFRAAQNSRLFNYFDYWGQNSLSLMVTHYSIVQVIITIIIEKLLNIPFVGWITIGAFIISMPIQYLITKEIDRRAPWLLSLKTVK